METTDAVHVAFAAARWSFTVTVPSWPLIVCPGNPDPKLREEGTSIVRFAVATVNVTVVSPDGWAAAGSDAAPTPATTTHESNALLRT
ncbi:hypothetical protein [Streptomyces jeddahensis]|uniref:hypothetical protein n=1 Tax=Streptomyces jeddahensis TaxID=1716141 RepID=UPI0018E3C391|nr:hypothetical protein [Streptomyces jeddahensis]